VGEFIGDGGETGEEEVTDGEVSGGGGVEVGTDLFCEFVRAVVDDIVGRHNFGVKLRKISI
jgi:hypothetical protein